MQSVATNSVLLHLKLLQYPIISKITKNSYSRAITTVIIFIK
jgi:hypothetical protein